MAEEFDKINEVQGIEGLDQLNSGEGLGPNGQMDLDEIFRRIDEGEPLDEPAGAEESAPEGKHLSQTPSAPEGKHLSPAPPETEAKHLQPAPPETEEPPAAEPEPPAPAPAPAPPETPAPKPEKKPKPAPKAKTPKAPEKKPEKKKPEERAVRWGQEYRLGCMGGLMYFAFIACISVVLACVAWMAASDVLAINKDNFTATVVLPADIFTSQTVDVLDEDGNKTGTERVTSADMDYVAAQLKEAGLIQYEWLFKLFCGVAHADTKVSPGEYELRSSFDYGALIRHMRAGSSSALTVDVTLPEGFSMYQIFKRLEAKGVCAYDELMDAAAGEGFNYSFLEGLEAGDAGNLEGYLFPDTYQFYVDMQASSAINKFLQTFNDRFTEDMVAKAQEMGYSVRDIVTIASYIEKEAANDEERAIIASVIYNRLAAGMPLGIDATILYLHPEHEGAPTADMLSEDTPYNTRLYTGLTPTPICSPGLASINAALNPESTNYYYYALDTATGTHRFFNSAEEHEAFVATQNYDG